MAQAVTPGELHPTLYVDDNAANVAAASTASFAVDRFTAASHLRWELVCRRLLPDSLPFPSRRVHHGTIGFRQVGGLPGSRSCELPRRL